MRVHHLALRADDVVKLADFYERLVGLPIERRNLPRSIWLRAGDTLVMIEQRAKGEPTVDGRTKELVAFSCRPTERGAVEARLVAGGVVIEEETDFTMYFRDPEGRRVALSHYPETEDPQDPPGASRPTE
jgi:glyoxylase I family protein